MKLSRKNKYLVAGFALLLVLSYKLAIQKTFEQRRTYLRNIEKQESISDLPRLLSSLKSKELILDNQFKILEIEGVSAQNGLLKYLNTEAAKYKVKIIRFDAPHHLEGELGNTETHIFIMEGAYVDLLKTLNAIENKGVFGSLVHLDFEKMKDYRSKRTYLQVQVFLEQVK